MSVKVQEAVCLDSAQDKFFWFDHFLGAQIQDEWTVSVAGAGGSAVVVDGVEGGIARLTAGPAATRNVQIYWGTIRSLLVSQRMVMEFRGKLNQITNCSAFYTPMNVPNSNIRFWFDTALAHANWQIDCNDGPGNQTTADSGIALDTDYHIFRITCHTHGGNHVHYEIDQVQCANSPITTDVPATYLQPYIFMLSNALVESSLDLDYVVAVQDR